MIGRYAEQYARDNGFKCILLDTGEVIEKGEPTAAADGRYVCEEKGDQCAVKRFKDLKSADCDHVFEIFVCDEQSITDERAVQHKKRLLTLFVLIAAFCMAFPAFAEIISDETTGASCGSGLKWSYDTDTKTLTVSGTGKMSDFDETSTGMLAPWRMVTKITGNLETVNILDSVSSIGDQAFAGTALYNEWYDNSELCSVLYIGNHIIK